MNVAPHNFKARRADDDVEDLAADFIEQEVGRFDWKVNWPKVKEKHPTPDQLRARVQAWLDHMEIDHDPQGIIDYLDTMVAERHGFWR